MCKRNSGPLLIHCLVALKLWTLVLSWFWCGLGVLERSHQASTLLVRSKGMEEVEEDLGNDSILSNVTHFARRNHRSFDGIGSPSNKIKSLMVSFLYSRDSKECYHSLDQFLDFVDLFHTHGVV